MRGASGPFHALALDGTEGASGEVVVEGGGAGYAVHRVVMICASESQAPMFDGPDVSAYGEVIGSGETSCAACRRRRRK
jgi:hypothetical protein